MVTRARPRPRADSSCRVTSRERRSRPDPRRGRRDVRRAGRGRAPRRHGHRGRAPPGPALLPRSGAGRVRRRPPSPTRPSRWPAPRWRPGGPVAAVGVTNQRASTIAWDRATGEPVGPGLGWQDLRTVGDCLVWQAEGLRFAPNESATKAAHLLDAADPDRTRDLCVGTVDAWVAWHLSGGEVFVTDASNAGVTGLAATPITRAGTPRCSTPCASPSGRCPRSSTRAASSASPPLSTGRPPSPPSWATSRRRSSGRGASCPAWPRSRSAPAGCSTCASGPSRRSPTARDPRARSRSSPGAGPARRCGASRRSCWRPGTNVEWLRDDLGIIDTAEQSHDVAAACETTDGVVYVPALLGLGTPRWDYGARGALLGITRGTGRPQVVRAVLEGVAQRGADLVEAAEADTGLALDRLRIDGGMSGNPTFVQAVANATGRPVEVSPEREATTLGAGFLAGLAVGHVGRVGRDRRHVAPGERRRARPRARPRPLARGCRPGRPVGARSQRDPILTPRRIATGTAIRNSGGRHGRFTTTHARRSSWASPSSWWRRPGSPGGGSCIRDDAPPEADIGDRGRDPRRGAGGRLGRRRRRSRATGRSTRRSVRSTTSRGPGPATASRRSWPASAPTPPSAAPPT